MSKQQDVLKLSPDERQSWLTEHLPNRIGSAWVWLPGLKNDWEWKTHKDFGQDADPNQVWCIGRAVENGQKAAMRWLIEFVGIRLKKKDDKDIPDRPIRAGTDVSIQSFVDDGADLQIDLDTDNMSSRAWILAKVWQGCSKSSVHSTFKTGHYRADPPQLAAAFMIIVEHLQEKLYKSECLSRILTEKK